MLKSIISVVAGYVVMAILVVITASIAAALLLDSPDTLTTSYLIANLILGFLSAAVGGFVTAKLAPQNPTRHVQALAAVIVVIGLLSMSQPLSGQPAWYPWTIMVVGITGVLLGGLYHGRKNSPVAK